MTSSPRLDRARREVDRAGRLAADGDWDLACSRAFFGAFYAAQAALELTDRPVPKTHGGVVNAFAELTRADGRIRDKEVARFLGSLARRRQEVDDDLAEPGPQDAMEAVETAGRVLEEVVRLAGLV